METPRDEDGFENVPAQAVLEAGGPVRVRIWAALVLLVCGGVLGVAIWLKPDPRGYGTHQQLGAGPCGMVLTTGLPCPTCGMTTAFSHTVRGQWLRAALAQPAGFLLALATIVAAATSFHALLTGRRPPLERLRVTPFQVFLILAVLLLGGWGWKLLIGFWDGTLPIQRVRL